MPPVTMRSLLFLYLLNLAIAPVFTATAKGKDKGDKKDFDIKSLSLREVGARNTVVGGKLMPMKQQLSSASI